MASASPAPAESPSESGETDGLRSSRRNSSRGSDADADDDGFIEAPSPAEHWAPEVTQPALERRLHEVPSGTMEHWPPTGCRQPSLTISEEPLVGTYSSCGTSVSSLVTSSPVHSHVVAERRPPEVSAAEAEVEVASLSSVGSRPASLVAPSPVNAHATAHEGAPHNEVSVGAPHNELSPTIAPSMLPSATVRSFMDEATLVGPPPMVTVPRLPLPAAAMPIRCFVGEVGTVGAPVFLPGPQPMERVQSVEPGPRIKQRVSLPGTVILSGSRAGSPRLFDGRQSSPGKPKPTPLTLQVKSSIASLPAADLASVSPSGASQASQASQAGGQGSSGLVAPGSSGLVPPGARDSSPHGSSGLVAPRVPVSVEYGPVRPPNTSPREVIPVRQISPRKANWAVPPAVWATAGQVQSFRQAAAVSSHDGAPKSLEGAVSGQPQLRPALTVSTELDTPHGERRSPGLATPESDARSSPPKGSGSAPVESLESEDESCNSVVSPLHSPTPQIRDLAEEAVITGSHCSGRYFDVNASRMSESLYWCAGKTDLSQWIQWDFRIAVELVAIRTRGNGNTSFVSLYDLEYFPEVGDDWVRLGSFEGNVDADTLAETRLKNPVVARKLWLRPRDWQNGIRLKAEVLGRPLSSDEAIGLSKFEAAAAERREPALALAKNRALGEVQKAENALASRDAELKAVTDQLELLRAEIAKKDKELEWKETVVNAATEQCRDMRQQLATKDAELTMRFADDKAKDKKLANMEHSMNIALRRADAEMGWKESVVTQASDTCRDMREQIEKFEKGMASKSAEIQRLEGSLSVTHQHNAEVQDQFANKVAELEQARDDIDSLRSELQKANQQCADLREQLQAKESELEQRGAEVAGKNAELARMEMSLQSTAMDHAALQEVSAQQALRIEEQDALLLQKDAEIESQSAELQALAQVVQQKDETLANVHQQLARKAEECAQNEAELRSALWQRAEMRGQLARRAEVPVGCSPPTAQADAKLPSWADVASSRCGPPADARADVERRQLDGYRDIYSTLALQREEVEESFNELRRELRQLPPPPTLSSVSPRQPRPTCGTEVRGLGPSQLTPRRLAA